MEFEPRFSTEQACHAYLAQLRWPHGFVCPRCQASSARTATRRCWICRACRHQTTATAGTIFQDSRKPLTLWFRAVWWVAAQKNGASALGLQRILGLGQYSTALHWLHKLRRAMVRPGRERLSGSVEVDEIYVGGREPAAGAGRGAVLSQRKRVTEGRGAWERNSPSDHGPPSPPSHLPPSSPVSFRSSAFLWADPSDAECPAGAEIIRRTRAETMWYSTGLSAAGSGLAGATGGPTESRWY